jgi:hypothetical protein
MLINFNYTKSLYYVDRININSDRESGTSAIKTAQRGQSVMRSAGGVCSCAVVVPRVLPLILQVCRNNGYFAGSNAKKDILIHNGEYKTCDGKSQA